MPRVRFQSPERLPGAAHFSDNPELRGSLNTVKLVKSQKWIWDTLREAASSLESGYARKREPGHWELVAVAFVSSRHIDIQPFWDESSTELWEACGFEGKPSYITTWRRLRELEQIADEFLAAAGSIIKRCRTHDSRVLSHVHVDFTEDESHAALVHDCRPDEDCAYKKGKGKKARAWGYAKRPERVSAQVARAERHALARDDPETATAREKRTAPQKAEVLPDGTKRVRVNGCWYRMRDAQAGVRAYTGPRGCRKFWVGFYGGKAVDHTTGGVIPSVDSASIQESQLFKSLFDRVCDMAGSPPQTVSADRGMSVSSCFEHATKRGTAPIFPWRRTGDGKRHDHAEYDRHGIKRCRACGGDMEQVRFSANAGSPRLWFRCMAQATLDCEGEQTISCKEDWRTLLPLSRTEPLYHELRESHQSYESAHDVWRDRYRVAGDTLACRPKAIGLDWHRLRAYTACLIDWLRVAAKADWLSDKPSKDERPGTRKFQEKGEQAAASLADTRVRLGLASAYGKAAAALGLGDATPPSERKHRWQPPPLPASP